MTAVGNYLTTVSTDTSISVQFSLLVFVANNRHCFCPTDIHNKNTRHNYNLHLPTTNLTLVQKAVLYSSSTIYNHLPTHIKTLSNDFKQSKLKTFFIEHIFYSIEQFYQLTLNNYSSPLSSVLLTLNIPSLARQRCLPRWGPRRTPWFFVISQLFDAVDYWNYVFWVSETIIQWFMHC
jgi:hypothetical protein